MLDPPVSQRSIGRLVGSMERAPALWVAAIVEVSTIVRGAVGLTVPSVWILPDEIVYSELAKSIAAGGRPAIRGVHVFGWGEVYPTLIAPAWALFGDPVRAYHVALGINALVMSLAAVPAYLLARMFVGRRPALLVALFTVLVPSMGYTGVVMTENACYPIFLLSVFLITRAVRAPSITNQACAWLGLVILAFTRIQGGALAGAYVAALALYALTSPASERRPYLARIGPTVALVLLAALAPPLVSIASGDGPFGWLGARSGTFDVFHPTEISEWLAYLTGDLVIYVAVAPFAATVVVIVQGLSRRAPERVRLFAAVATPTFVSMLVSVSLVSASLDVDGVENLNERYLFYVVPLMFCGLAIWVREGMPRRRPWVLWLVGLCCLLAIAVPIGRLGYNAGFQSPSLIPWLDLSLSRPELAAVVAAFVLLCGAVWLHCSRARVWLLWIVVATWMSFVGVLTVRANSSPAHYFERAFKGQSASWVDRAVPPHSQVAVIWDERVGRAAPPDFYRWLGVIEFFNKTVGPVYRLGPRTHYEGFLPTIPVEATRDGSIVDGNGRKLRPRYVLVPCWSRVRGTQIGESPGGALRLVRTARRVQLQRAPSPRPTLPPSC